MEEDKKINLEKGKAEALDMNEDGTGPLAEEEEREIAVWKEKRRRTARKRRRKLIWHVALTMILTVAVFAGGILYAMGKLPGITKGTAEKLTVVWEKMVSLLPEGNQEDNNIDSEDTQEEMPKEDLEEEGDAVINLLWGNTQQEESAYVKATADKLEKEQDARMERRLALRKAKQLAAQYDYDGAIDAIKSYENYTLYQHMTRAVSGYKKIKKSCVSWPIEEVTHIFYHTLIKDTDKAFDGDYKAGDYNQVMTTIEEFNQITQSMYEKGYVMVSIYDLATVNEDGTMSRGEILLPPGKIPFILSQDDVCYYHYMDGDGFASRLVVDEEGKIRNEYIEDDGSVSVGDYDVVPLIDRFVEEHPDFSYKGAKGIVALTGYNGILGYRTDSSYETQPEDLDENKAQWLAEHPDFSLEEEREGAKKVADAMKEEGWLFASHTWGHLNVGEIELDRLQADTQKFKENVDPLIGGTDIIIFAFGADLSQIEDYSGEKFEYLKSSGYNYYCNVDSSQYFVQLRDNYFRMGRRNLDGYRMYYNPELVEDLFDASEVFDKSRPTPVPPM